MICEKPGIVIACDLRSLEALARLVEATNHLPEVTGFKLGSSLALLHGLPKVVSEVRSRTAKPIIYDNQKAATDIPQSASDFAETCAESHLDGAILFPLSGPATLETYIEEIQRLKVTPIVGAVMTHPRFLVSEGGYIRDDVLRLVLEIALAKGVNHFVLPATKPEYATELREAAIRNRVGQIFVLSPGIGRQKADVERVRKSFAGLNWSPIVGSAIYNSDDPGAEASRIAREFDLPC